MTFPTLAFFPLVLGLCATLATATNRRLQIGLFCAIALVLAAGLAGRFG
ncbi:hypothetical protein NX783_00855 [Massilia kyonggiensis]|jgi:hypothetical protein|nr:hypothetical protein [Massilia kyonggiensis]